MPTQTAEAGDCLPPDLSFLNGMLADERRHVMRYLKDREMKLDKIPDQYEIAASDDGPDDEFLVTTQYARVAQLERHVAQSRRRIAREIEALAQAAMVVPVAKKRGLGPADRVFPDQ